MGAFSVDDAEPLSDEATYIMVGSGFGGGGDDTGIASDAEDLFSNMWARAAPAGPPPTAASPMMTPASLADAAAATDAKNRDSCGGRVFAGAAPGSCQCCDGCLCLECKDKEPAERTSTTVSRGTGFSADEPQPAVEPDCFLQLGPRLRGQVMEAVREVSRSDAAILLFCLEKQRGNCDSSRRGRFAASSSSLIFREDLRQKPAPYSMTIEPNAVFDSWHIIAAYAPSLAVTVRFQVCAELQVLFWTDLEGLCRIRQVLIALRTECIECYTVDTLSEARLELRRVLDLAQVPLIHSIPAQSLRVQ